MIGRQDGQGDSYYVEGETRVRRELGLPLPHEHHGLVHSLGQVALLAEANRIRWEEFHPPKQKRSLLAQLGALAILLFILSIPILLILRMYLWTQYGIDPYFEDWHWHWRH
jgi:hypothetical protein